MKYTNIEKSKLISSVNVNLGETERDGVYKPTEKMLKSVQKVLSKIPINTEVDFLISNLVKSRYVYPPPTIILHPKHYNNSDVIVHEFGHHIWNYLINKDKQKKWQRLIEKHGRVNPRRKKDIYNEDFATGIQVLFGKRKKPSHIELHPKQREFLEDLIDEL